MVESIAPMKTDRKRCSLYHSRGKHMRTDSSRASAANSPRQMGSARRSATAVEDLLVTKECTLSSSRPRLLGQTGSNNNAGPCWSMCGMPGTSCTRPR
eukprot:5674420-Amphidinium_carterae.1